MNTKAWVACELTASGQTPLDLFTRCWERVFRDKCTSNAIVIDANQYRLNGKIPYYVARAYELYSGRR